MTPDDLTAAASLSTVIATGFLVLCDRIKEGLITKIGLLIVLFACAADVTRWIFGLDSYVGMYHSATAVRTGITVVVVGIVVQRWRRKR